MNTSVKGNPEGFARLAQWAKNHGVTVEVVSTLPAFTWPCDSAATGLYPCPFDDATIVLPQKKLECLDNCHLGSLIHELGHMLAVEETPDHAEEVRFLYWEYMLAKELDLYEVWDEDMASYYLDWQPPEGGKRVGEWCSLKEEQKPAYLAFARSAAEQFGCVSDGKMVIKR